MAMALGQNRGFFTIEFDASLCWRQVATTFGMRGLSAAISSIRLGFRELGPITQGKTRGFGCKGLSPGPPVMCRGRRWFLGLGGTLQMFRRIVPAKIQRHIWKWGWEISRDLVLTGNGRFIMRSRKGDGCSWTVPTAIHHKTLHEKGHQWEFLLP